VSWGDLAQGLKLPELEANDVPKGSADDKRAIAIHFYSIRCRGVVFYYSNMFPSSSAVLSTETKIRCYTAVCTSLSVKIGPLNGR
jgi:hypothetical protein